MQESDNKAEEFASGAHEQWVNDWEYFCTDSIIKVPDLVEPVQSLKLPRNVIDKIYYRNAEKIFRKLPKI
jgi:predicted TIM-barrel fold metal-dependent hydrolase